MTARAKPKVILRHGKAADVDACADIHLRARAAWRFLPREPHTEDETRAWMRHVVFVEQQIGIAEADGRIAGYLSREGTTVTGLYIAPEHQNRGIGAALLNMAKGDSPEGLTLWVFEANGGAIRFYERHGFRTCAQTDGRDNDEGCPDCEMSWAP